MSLIWRWSGIRQHTISCRAFQLSRNTLSPGQVRNSSLSAIHRGIHRSERAGSQNDHAGRSKSKPRFDEARGERRNRTAAEPPKDAFAARFSGAVGGSRGPSNFKPKGKKGWEMKEQEEEGGRKSRSKRFNNPEFSFGKKSLVYQINRGEMKDKIAKLLDKEGPREEDTSTTRRNSSAWEEGFGGERGRDQGNSGFHAKQYRPETARSKFRSMRQKALEEVKEDTSNRFGARRNSSAQRENFGRGRLHVQRNSGFHSMQSNNNSEIDDSWESNRPTDVPMPVQYTTAASQFLYGRSVVKAALRNNRRKLYHLYIQKGEAEQDSKTSLDEDIFIAKEAKEKGINFSYVSDQKFLDKMSQGRPHNRLVLEASPLPQLPLESLGRKRSEPHGYDVAVARQSKEELEINGATGFIPCKEESARPLVLLLHEIMDPGNLGGILRTARFFGVSAVAITTRTSSAITPTVLKASAGAAEELILFSVKDPKEFLEASERAGWTPYAAVAPGSSVSRSRHHQQTLDNIEDLNPLMTEPCILVLGNEGKGLPRDIRRRVRHEVTIPQLAARDLLNTVDSLNVSVAAALLCHSFLRGTTPKKSLTLTEKLHADGLRAGGGGSLF